MARPGQPHGRPPALPGRRGPGWASRGPGTGGVGQGARRLERPLWPLVLGALQEVVLDVAHAVHLVARSHPPVEAALAEVVLVWARRKAEVEG